MSVSEDVFTSPPSWSQCKSKLCSKMMIPFSLLFPIVSSSKHRALLEFNPCQIFATTQFTSIIDGAVNLNATTKSATSVTTKVCPVCRFQRPMSISHTLPWQHQKRRRIRCSIWVPSINLSSKSGCPMRLVRYRSFTNVSNTVLIPTQDAKTPRHADHCIWKIPWASCVYTFMSRNTHVNLSMQCQIYGISTT